MKKTFKILKISKKKVATKFGDKDKYNIECKTEKGIFWADSWVNKSNHGWAEGMTVTADITSRLYDGKTYYNATPQSLEELILEKLERIENKLNGVVTQMPPQQNLGPFVDEEEPPHTDAEAPSDEEEESIPF